MSFNEKMTAIADAIRSKTGKSDALTLDQMAEDINGLSVGNDTIVSGGDAEPSDILAGRTAYVQGNLITGTIQNKDAETYVPNNTDQVISAGQYLSGDQIISGDTNLVPENIREGISIFGVDGSMVADEGIDTSDATATETDLANGKTAYVDGEKITGSINTINDGESATVDAFQIWYDKNNDNVNFIYKNNDADILLRKGSLFYVEMSSLNCGDATASDVIAGKTFTSKAGVKVTGTHECSGADTADATATASDIASGKTAYVQGEKITGTAVFGATVLTATSTLSISDLSISFTGLTDEPKMFSLIPTGSITLGMGTRYVQSVVLDGTTIGGVYAYGSGVTYNATYYSEYTTTGYSWKYTDGALTITSASSNSGYFKDNVVYQLTYAV